MPAPLTLSGTGRLEQADHEFEVVLGWMGWEETLMGRWREDEGDGNE